MKLLETKGYFCKNKVMKSLYIKAIILFICISCIQCKNKLNPEVAPKASSTVQYAKGFTITNYQGYSIVTVKNPWPKASKTYTYILKEKGGIIPDSLLQNPVISVPIKTIVVTSTTHIPSLEMLGEVNSLVGFPHCDYISSTPVRARIESGHVKELGTNQDLNTEVLLDLQPDVIIGYGIDNRNPTLDNLERSGLKILLDGDWNEETPLGKAEWIKFFGALYGKQKEANQLFSSIAHDYLELCALAKTAKTEPSVLVGDIYEDRWYLPKGDSWGSQLLREAHANYLWASTSGTGSLSLSFETVFEKAKSAEVWFTSGQFDSLTAMTNSNPHYKEFDAFQNKRVYSFCKKKGKTGGILYYELAPNRPDLVLKDLVKIVHPELLPSYQPFFFEQLK
jgi:iron complex transport system substrate-binding protein